ncbi:uncharacterized protein LOC127849184 [Dreissena polymorpha]|uniref:Uncharacterized protein n=1 Tax=Dreissena polymorpha TaxID=45954 RepID=A0A9D4DPJ8_DREPO|nr:uncharacterized protein LOC127849184 [Dreissena polymorpha]KAH3753074.1 hypothetical protein DPMN_187704 [Dreissena polymorpha]
MAPVLAHHVRQLLLLLAGFIDAVKAGSFCYYIHEDYYDWRQTYCESGCCRQHGDEDEICCFSWTIGIIMGIAFACVGFIAVIAFLVVCCHQMKKRGRIGSTLQQAVGVHQAPAYPQNNTVVFAISIR